MRQLSGWSCDDAHRMTYCLIVWTCTSMRGGALSAIVRAGYPLIVQLGTAIRAYMRFCSGQTRFLLDCVMGCVLQSPPAISTGMRIYAYPHTSSAACRARTAKSELLLTDG